MDAITFEEGIAKIFALNVTSDNAIFKSKMNPLSEIL